MTKASAKRPDKKALARLLGALAMQQPPVEYGYNGGTNTLTVKGDLDVPVKGMDINLHVHGLVKKNVDITGCLRVGDFGGAHMDTGINPDRGKIKVHAGELLLDDISLIVTGNVDIVIDGKISGPHGFYMHGDKVRVTCAEIFSPGRLCGGSIYDGAQVRVKGNAEIDAIHGGRHIEYKKGKPRQPTTLEAKNLVVSEIDQCARVYVRNNLKFDSGIIGGAEVYVGGKISCGTTDFAGKIKAPIGVAVGHGTLTDARTLVIGKQGVTCGDLFNAAVAGAKVKSGKPVQSTKTEDILPPELAELETRALAFLEGKKSAPPKTEDAVAQTAVENPIQLMRPLTFRKPPVGPS